VPEEPVVDLADSADHSEMAVAVFAGQLYAKLTPAADRYGPGLDPVGHRSSALSPNQVRSRM
jgi:hypothetical protein